MLVSYRPNSYKALIRIAKTFFWFFLAFLLVHFLCNTFPLINEYRLPSQVVMLLTSVLSIFIGFRINAAYNRWLTAGLDAGRLLGVLVDINNASLQILREKGVDEACIKAFLYRNILYFRILAIQLRTYDRAAIKEEFDRAVSRGVIGEGEARQLQARFNPATALMAMQLRFLNDHQMYTLVCIPCSNAAIFQSNLESYKLIPFSWGYAFYTRLLVRLFPIALVMSQYLTSNMIHNAILVFISIMFITLENVAQNLDTPFVGRFSDVPLTAMGEMLERKARDILGEAVDVAPIAHTGGVIN